MNKIICEIVNTITSKLKELEDIEGVVIYGSYTRGELDYYSDIDLAVYFSSNLNKKEILNEIIKAIKIHDEILLVFEKHEKVIIYTIKYFVKIEVTIKKISDITREDLIFIKESRVDNFRDAILFDRNGKIKEIYEHLWLGLKEDLSEKARYHIFSFLYYYDIFSVHFTRGDIYRAYMNYTIAFYHLASVLSIAHGEYRNIYQPWYLTKDILEKDSLRDFYDSSSSMNPIDMFYHKEKMLRLFLATVENIERQFNLNIINQVRVFTEKIHEKYPPFYNFRDISKIVNMCSRKIKIRSGLIFRSASLSRYKSKTILDLLRTKNIKYIIDLRPADEYIIYGKKPSDYPMNIKHTCVVNIPISTRVKSYMEHPYINMYYGVIRESKDSIRKIFEEYIANADKAPIIIHCEGGKDRTGIVIALLLGILGVEKECIIEDYLASYSDTKREYIDFLLDVLEREYGGIESYLVNYCGVSMETIEKIRKILVV